MQFLPLSINNQSNCIEQLNATTFLLIKKKGYVNGSGALQYAGSERPPENLSIAVPVTVPASNASPFLCKPFVETSSKATYGNYTSYNPNLHLKKLKI